MIGNTRQCYMCDSPATSSEHVPPKCIFPERKDLDGKDLRTQLITVPSCALHNSKKSKDDEFLMVSLAGIIGNNSIGYRHKWTKVNRAIRNTSGRLLDAVFLKREHFVIKVEDNAFFEVIWGTPDQNRLERSFEQIARGLFFHEFGVQFQGRLKVLIGYLHRTQRNPATFVKFIRHRAEIELKGHKRLGSNPSVFYYQFTSPDEHGLRLVKLCFYGGLDIFVAFLPNGAVMPVSLSMQLIERGIKSFIELDGTTYEFN